MISNLLNLENFKLILVGFRKLTYLKYCKIHVGFIGKNELRRLFEYSSVIFTGVLGELHDHPTRFGGPAAGYCSS